MSEPAGWYTNPDGSNSERYWDGSRWTHQVRPFPYQPGVPSDLDPTRALSTDPTPVVDPLGRDGPVGRDPGFGPDAESGRAGIGHPQRPVERPGPGAEGDEPRESGPASGSLSDVLRVLVDLSLERTITADLARGAYRLGVIATVVVTGLLLLVGVASGGRAAVVSIVLWPMLGLLALLHLRAVLQAAVTGPTGDAPGIDEDHG
jgi:hypothetical protein